MPRRANPLLRQRDWLRARYVDRRLPVADIAEEAGADISTVHRWLRRHHLPARRHGIDRADVEWRLRLRQSVPRMAADLGVDSAVIWDRLYRWGLATVGGAADHDHDQIRRWYVVEGWSIQRIADEIDLSRRATTRVLLAAGITLRRPGRRSP